jgi:hypothetical protein
VATYPPRPLGDVHQLDASIRRLEDLRQRVAEAIVRPQNRFRSIRSSFGNYQLSLGIGLMTARTVAHGSLGDIDGALGVLRDERRRVDTAIQAWVRECNRITAEASAP